ncbi:hypothetical protein G6F56_005062 [Rhizopus delemar]|nr:hypothetical protein G6F56_005062 [Rhizopus delemar]
MKSVFAAILAVAAAAVSAQSNTVSITSPLTGTVYTAGKAATITWINPSVTTISQIVLAQGSSTALQQVSVIASNVDASALSYTWTIPADTAAGTDYALELGTSPNISYTGLFTIQAASGSTASSASGSSSSTSSTSQTASAASTTSAAATSAKSSASGSSSAAASSAAASSTSAGLKVSANQAVAGVMAVAAAAMLM